MALAAHMTSNIPEEIPIPRLKPEALLKVVSTPFIHIRSVYEDLHDIFIGHPSSFQIYTIDGK